MAGSVFDPSIDTRGAASSFRVEQPIQDTVTPQLAGLLTKGVMHLAREDAITDLTGDGRMAAEAAADPNLLSDQNGTPAEKEAALNSIDTLSKLASARKAGLPIGQAKSRATALLKRSVNDNPFFATEIREAYNKFFGGTGSGVFDLTPEEKAVEDYRERVTKRSMDLGLPVEQAALSVRQEEANKLHLQSMEVASKERTLSSDGFATYAQVNTTTNVDAFTQGVISRVKKGGPLSPEEVASYKVQISALRTQLKSQQNKLLLDENGRIRTDFVDRQGIDAANKLVDDQINSLTALIDDPSALKLSADNYNLLNNNYNTLMIEHFGEYKMLEDVLGEQATGLLYQNMLGNKHYVNVLKNDPQMQNLFAKGDDFTKDLLGRQMNAFAFSTGKKEGTPEPADQAAWLGAIGGGMNNQITTLAQQPGNKVGEMTRQAIELQPNALAMFKNKQWATQIDSDPQARAVFEEGLIGYSRALRKELVSEIDSFDLSGVQIRVIPARIPLNELGSYQNPNANPGTLDVSGDISSGVRGRVKELYDMAVKHPSVWKGKAESAVDYINQLIKLPKTAPIESPVSQRDPKQVAAEQYATGQITLEELQAVLGGMVS